MKKAACFYADGTEEVELLSVVDVLRRADVQADLISVSGDIPVSAHGIAIRADRLIEEAEMDQYDVIYIPGGSRGAKALSENEQVIRAIQNFHSQGKLVAAICAGPTVLEKAGILKGHEGTSYPGFKDKLSFALYRQDLVIVSDPVVTSRGPATALLLGFEILRQLDLHDKADEIWDNMLMDQLEDHFRK